MQQPQHFKAKIRGQDKKSVYLMLFSEFLFRMGNPVIFVLLFRYTDLNKVGYYSFVNFLTVITLMIVGFGMEYYISNDLAKDPEKADRELGSTLMLKVPLSAVYIIISYAYCMFFTGAPPIIFILTVVIGFQLANHVSATFTSILILKRFSLISQVSRFIFMWVFLAANIVSILIWRSFDIWLIVSGTLFTVNMVFLIALTMLYCKIPLKITLKNFKGFNILKACFPYFLIGILAFAYTYIGVLVLYNLEGPKSVVYYRTVFSLYLMTNLIPASFLAIFTPRLSELQKISRPGFLSQSFKILHYVLILDLAVVFLFVYLSDLVLLVFGNRLTAFPGAGAARAVRIFIYILIPYTLSNILGTLLIIMGVRKWIIALNFAALLAEVCGVLLLIPRFSVWGCIYSHLAVECLLASGTVVLFKHYAQVKTKILSVFKYLLFILVMSALYGTASSMHFVLRLAVCSAYFLILGLGLRLFTISDLAAMLNIYRHGRNGISQGPETF